MKNLLYIFLLFSAVTFAQSNDEIKFKEIYKTALTNSKCYAWLDDLSNKVGARLSGSIGAQKGVEYTKAQLETLGLDRVFLQEVMVPKWVRGEKEVAYILDTNNKINIPLIIC